jgi:hypothetical protein
VFLRLEECWRLEDAGIRSDLVFGILSELGAGRSVVTAVLTTPL